MSLEVGFEWASYNLVHVTYTFVFATISAAEFAQKGPGLIRLLSRTRLELFMSRHASPLSKKYMDLSGDLEKTLSKERKPEEPPFMAKD